MNNIEKYIPEQYARNRHYVKKMVEKFKSLDFWNDYVDEFYDFLRSPTVNASEESDVAEAYISFYRSGRNIIEIPFFLSNLLGFTDIDNVRLADVKLPYEAVYFHFDKVVDMSQESIIKYSSLVGAYVAKWLTEDVLNFVLCFKDSECPYLCFSLEPNPNRKDKCQMINEAIITTYEIDKRDLDYDFYEIKDYSNDSCDSVKRIIYKSIRLIVNCICYLNSTEKDIKLITTNEQATELIQQLEKTKKTQQRTKITQKLSKLSYSKIHLLGQNLQKEYESIKATGREVEPHWRRGHWRNQPYGKELSEARLIWIKPTIVRKDKGNPERGHIYKV